MPPGLESAVLLRVRTRERREAQARLTLVGGSSIISLVAAVPVSQYITESIAQSGTLDYASMAFSDMSALSSLWREFVFSCIESFPFLGIIALLSVTGIFLWTSVRAVREVRVAFIRPTVIV